MSDGPSSISPKAASASTRETGDSAAWELIENGTEGMLLIDAHGFITFASASCREFLGLPPGDLVGTSWFDLYDAADRPEARDAFARCVDQPGGSVLHEIAVLQPSGDRRTVSVRLSNRLPMPGIGAVLIHLGDAPSDARDTGEAYRALFDGAVTGLVVTDVEGNLLAFNDAVLAPGGYSRDDALRMGDIGRFYATEADRERVRRIARERGRVSREEVKFLRKDGSTYDALLSFVPVRFRGKRCWYATVEDVTHRRRVEAERKELEAKLWQAQKMQAVGQMTAGIAHDFNNILQVISTNAELLTAELGPEAEERYPDLAQIRSAARRGGEMITRLLGFSRSASLSIEPNNVAAVVDDLHPTLARLIPPDILLEMSLAEQSTARCDRGAIAEMLVNLATNARDAMPEGGTLRIAIGPALVAPDSPDRPPWMTPGEFVRLSVSDNGVGMDEATRDRVLEPFFTTKGPGAGTGLGLPMVYGLAKQQGGFIDIQSERGHGTTVHLYLPVAS